MKKHKNILLGISALALLAACGKDKAANNPVEGAISTAKQQLQSAIPTATVSTAQALSAMQIDPLSAATFGTNITALRWPGGACLNRSANNSPSKYFSAVLDPDFLCEGEEGDFAPTVFARFDQETKILATLAANLTYTNSRVDAGTYTFDFTEQDQTMELTLVATDLSSGEFDTKLVVSPIGWEGYFKNRDGIINLFGFEEDDSGLGWSHFFYDANTGELAYEFARLQPSGSTQELNRLLRPAGSNNAYLLHRGVVEVGQPRTIVAYAPGSSATELTAGVELVHGGGTFTASPICVTLANVSAAAGRCSAHAAANAIALADIDGLEDFTWANKSVIFDKAIPGTPSTKRLAFDSKADFVKIYK